MIVLCDCAEFRRTKTRTGNDNCENDILSLRPAGFAPAFGRAEGRFAAVLMPGLKPGPTSDAAKATTKADLSGTTNEKCNGNCETNNNSESQKQIQGFFASFRMTISKGDGDGYARGSGGILLG